MSPWLAVRRYRVEHRCGVKWSRSEVEAPASCAREVDVRGIGRRSVLAAVADLDELLPCCPRPVQASALDDDLTGTQRCLRPRREERPKDLHVRGAPGCVAVGVDGRVRHLLRSPRLGPVPEQSDKALSGGRAGHPGQTPETSGVPGIRPVVDHRGRAIRRGRGRVSAMHYRRGEQACHCRGNHPRRLAEVRRHAVSRYASW